MRHGIVADVAPTRSLRPAAGVTQGQFPVAQFRP
jgi:hypothetical protein